MIIVDYGRPPKDRKEAHHIARDAAAALLLSNSIRRDTVFIAYFSHTQSLLELRGDSVRNLRADEESAAGLLWSLLRTRLRKSPAPGPGTCVSPGRAADCPPSEDLCRALTSPFHIALPGRNTPFGCSGRVVLSSAPTSTHLIIRLNMVLDLCEGRS